MLLPIVVTIAVLTAIALLAILVEPSATRLAAAKLQALAYVLHAHATARECGRYAHRNAYRSMRARQAELRVVE